MTKTTMRNMFIIFAILALLVGMMYFFNFSVVGSYILDLNPSIQINTNRLGKVTSLEPLNQDGLDILNNYKLKDRDLDDVIEDLVDRLILAGYFKDELDNAIMVSHEGEGRYSLSELKGKLDEHLNYRQIDGRIVTKELDDRYDDDILKELGMSGARLELIEEIRRKEGRFTPDELKNMKVGDLLYILRKTDTDFDDLFDDWDDIDDDYDDYYESIYGVKFDDLDDDWDDDFYDDDRDDDDDLFDDDWDDDDDDDDWDDDNYVAPAPAPAPATAPAPAPRPAPPARVYYDDDDDDDWDDDDWDDDWDDDDDDDWDDDDWDDDWDDDDDD